MTRYLTDGCRSGRVVMKFVTSGIEPNIRNP